MPDEVRLVLGDDEYLVDRRASEIFAPWKAEAADEFAVETIDARSQNADEIASAVGRFAEAARTDSLFGGGGRTVWLRHVNFLGADRLGQGKAAKEGAERLRDVLEGLVDGGSRVLVSGAPVDRKRSFYKWAAKREGFEGIDSKKAGPAAFQRVVEEECRAGGATMSRMALEILRGKLNGEIRVAAEETRKLVTALPEGRAEITEEQVLAEVPEFGEAEFFEAADKFFRGDLREALEAIRRHFFSQKEGRPLLSNLLNRNRLMIQIRVLVDAGMVRVGGNRVDERGLAAAAEKAAPWYGETERKNPVNVFGQNAYYLGNLAAAARRLPLRSLFDYQTAFVETFRELVDRPDEHEAVFRELAVRCLGPKR